MKFQLVGNWPVQSYLLPNGFIVDSANAATDNITALALTKTPPANALPLDAAAQTAISAEQARVAANLAPVLGAWTWR